MGPKADFLNLSISQDTLSPRLLFAIPKKGRLYEQCLHLLQGADIQFHRKNRLDIALSTNQNVAVVFLPACDIPKFVGQGTVDLGITGQDMVAESNVPVKELLPLGFGKCDLCVQVPVNNGIKDVKDLVGKRVVTSFENLVQKYFSDLEAEVKPQKKTTITYVSGSVEAACSLGLADAVVDLVESGETMRAAGLTKLTTLLTSQAVLISNNNPAHPQLISTILNRIKGVITASKYVLCNYNIPRAQLKEAMKITPGKKAPTVAPLEDTEWVSVSSMVVKKEVVDIMDKLESIGATDILVFNISNCRAG